MDHIGIDATHSVDEGIWLMSSDIVLSPQVWNWYVEFFISMGMVIAAAISFAFGILLVDWLYLIAKSIESKPTPSSLFKAYFNLSRFGSVVIGVFLAPIGSVSLYYLLFPLIWKLAPNTINAPPLEFGADSFMENLSSMASLVLWVCVSAFSITMIAFIALCAYAKGIDPERTPYGWLKRFTRRYFKENLVIGFILMLIAFPVLAYLLYNITLLAMVISPSARHELTRFAFPNAENIYIKFLQAVGSWLIIIVFIPAAWFLFRGGLLRWRYIKENTAMNVIFKRSVKYSILGLLGSAGCMIMHYWAESLFKFIITTGFK